MVISISAITPCYRTENYIEDFLHSIQHQSCFDNLEVILDLNNPSKYELAVTAKYKKAYGKHLKILKNDEVSNIAASMNRAIKSSAGKYLAIWNVDDLRTQNSLALQSELLEENDKIVACGGNFKVVSRFGETEGRYVVKTNLDPAMLLSGMHLGPFFMFRKDIINKIGYFDEQFISGADFDFALRLARAGKIEFTGQDLGYYLDAGLGASTRKDSSQVVERTVIEMRYGLFDKIDETYLPSTYKYSIPYLEWDSEFHFVGDYFENYMNLMSSKLEIISQKSRRDLRQIWKRQPRS